MRGNRLIAPLAVLALAVAAPALGNAAETAPLRVCAASDNMPFSNAKGEGFENKIATLVAHDLARPVADVWLAGQADDEVAAVDDGRCDLIVGLPVGANPDRIATTHPYYWSSYVLLSRAARRLDVSSLKDHRLRGLKIGVPSIGGDPLYSPPARTLAELGLGKDLVGFPIDRGSGAAPPRPAIVDAVARGSIDAAAVWGPFAGYFAKRADVPLRMTPIGDTDQFSSRKTHFELLGLQYEIAMGVRRGDAALRDALDRVIDHDRPRLEAVLRDYGVPLIEPTRLSDAEDAAK